MPEPILFVVDSVRGRRRPPPSDERRRRRRRRRRHRGAFRLGVSQQGVTAQTATRASSVLVTNARSAESSDETGTERPASARASSVLEDLEVPQRGLRATT